MIKKNFLLVDNSSEEIKFLALEIEKEINGKKIENEQDKVNQEKFWKVYMKYIDLKSKVYLVTGANGRIGYELSKQLINLGITASFGAGRTKTYRLNIQQFLKLSKEELTSQGRFEQNSFTETDGNQWVPWCSKHF